MTEYQLTIPTSVGHRVADDLYKLNALAGGSTFVVGVGSWEHPATKERINEGVGQHTFIVDDCTPSFVDQLNATVQALHREGEHTVLVRRLSGRGIVHFFLTKGMEVPYR